MSATAQAPNVAHSNSIVIIRTPTGVGVALTAVSNEDFGRTLLVEVYDQGRLIASRELNATMELPWRDYFGNKVNHLGLWIRVLEGPNILAELSPPPEEFVHPFMVLQPKISGGQQHITESYVSVPPALHITDEVGAVWTLGFATAPKEKSPKGEYAFEVLRDGQTTGVIASRIERRNGKVRAFTKRQGWLVWNGREFL